MRQRALIDAHWLAVVLPGNARPPAKPACSVIGIPAADHV
jgi:hypothetical protein